MLWSRATLARCVKPTRVTACKKMAGVREIKASITRQHEAYKTLDIIRDGILTLGPIVEEQDAFTFDVVPSEYYAHVIDATEHDLIWCADIQGVSYEESVKAWETLLEQPTLKTETVDRIRLHDLNDPRFGDFRITLMEYLISSEVRNGYYHKMADWSVRA